MNRTIVVITSVLAAAGIAWGVIATHNQMSMAKQLASAQTALAARDAAAASRDEQFSEMQTTLGQITTALKNSTAKLADARREAADYKSRLATYEMSQAEKEDRQKLAGQVPVKRDGDTVLFPLLPNKSGVTLMANALFVRTNGRKLIFKSGQDYGVYDVDAVHPGVLAQLNLSADNLKAAQIAMDKKNGAEAAMNAQALAAKLKADGAFLAAEAKRNAAQAKEDELKRQQQFKEQLAAQDAANDRLRAQAAMKAAQAAMVEATRPY